MLDHMKLKLVVPMLAAAISTTAFAANDTQASLSMNSLAYTQVAAISPNSSAGLNRNALARNADRADLAVQNSDADPSSAIATQPANSNDTCMGSKSTGMQLPVVGGISFGSSWTDKNCMMIKNARELWNMGYKTAALARMCMDEGNREALESTGTPCPTRRTESTSRKTATLSLNDPQ